MITIPSACRPSYIVIFYQVWNVPCAACNERLSHLEDIILRQLGHLLFPRGPHGDEVDQTYGRLDARQPQTTQHDTEHGIQMQQRNKRRGDQKEREGAGGGTGSC